MNRITYRMTKSAYDHRTGCYTSIERDVGNLTLADVRRRIARLPETTDWLWSVEKRLVNADGSTDRLGSINASEFSDDVPDFR